MPQTLYTQVSDINSSILVRSYPFPQPDMNADKLLFDEVADLEIEELLDENPQIIGEFELKGALYPIMRSQPIPNLCQWNDPRPTEEGYTLCVTLGSGKRFVVQYRSPVHRCCLAAQWAGKARPMRTQTYALRAPEVILGADYGVKVDIWALGCMVRPNLDVLVFIGLK